MPVKLIKFSATNYRSITSAHRINFSDTTVLIGRNNEGKSNLLRALEASMQILRWHAERRPSPRVRRFLPDEVPYVWTRDFPIQLQARRAANQTIFKLEFLLSDAECEEFRCDVGPTINGTLPIEIKIGRDQEPHVRLVNPGKGTRSLESKSSLIANFVAERIHFNYIPAIRTDNTTIDLIAGLLAQELRSLESDQRYIDALATISELQRPVLDELAERVQGPLKEFLPSISSVKLEISESSRRYSLRRDVNVFIDDGTNTLLEYKGDGVKSLAALGLLKSRGATGTSSILAIEEPESHLHPGAIHQVNEIIQSIAKTSQVIITTHNPLFVDRENVKSNVIVSAGSATPAKSVSEIRSLLGIKASDNLMNASYALVVEGAEDVVAMKSLLPLLSEKLGRAIKNNMLIIEPIGGAGNLSYKLSLLRNSLCAVHVFLDGDAAGREAYGKAEREGLVTTANCTFVNCNGMAEAEFEDCLNADVYREAVLTEFGINLSHPSFRGNHKWSQRIREACLTQGKNFNEDLLTRIKFVVGCSVANEPKSALNEHKRNSIDAVVAALERMVKS